MKDRKHIKSADDAYVNIKSQECFDMPYQTHVSMRNALCRLRNVKTDGERLPRCIEKFNIWFLEPWSNYYFLGCDKTESISHRTQNVSTHIVIRCFCRNLAHKTMMPERVAEMLQILPL